MRVRIFRGMAGVLAALFVGVLLFTDFANRPLSDVALFAFIGCMFGLYAAMGEDVAERWIGMGGAKERRPDDEADDRDGADRPR